MECCCGGEIRESSTDSSLRRVVWSSWNGQPLDFSAVGLTSRARREWPDGVRRAFRGAGAALHDPRWAILDQIEPATWENNKSDALDPKSEFWWIDDAPSLDDVNWLRVHGCEDRLIKISTDIDPEALMRLLRQWSRK